MKKVYLIHGWGGSSKSEGWFKSLKQKLLEKGIDIEAFDMPNTNTPKIEEWIGFLQKKIKNKTLDEETYFIGHSIGCQTILRYLEKLPQNVKIAGCVFVAGWFNLKGLDKEEEKIAEPWLKTKINFDKVKKHCNNFLAIFSDNDPFVVLNNTKLFKHELNAKIIIKKNEGHFNETLKIPEIMTFLR